jgi:hypothetical protein
MSIKTNLQSTRAVLMGASHFPKDKDLTTLENVSNNIKELNRIFSDKRILGLFSNNIVSLYNTPDNTKIKEELAISAESATDTLIFYYSGYIILRRGQVYLSTVNSSKAQVHVNAISLAELANIIRENENATKILILDCVYQHAEGHTLNNAQQIVKEEFNKFEESIKTAYIIASSPETTLDIFKSENPSSLTNQFIKILETGSKKETDELSLNDIFEGISEKVRAAGQFEPIRGSHSPQRNRGFVNNLKFIEYKKFKTEGDSFFAKESFGEALPLYQYATKLYNNDSDLNNKIDFINFVSEANKHFSKLAYENARQNYQYAYQLFPIQSIKSKIDTSVERMAEEYFRNEYYEKAKESYEFLVKSFPDNEIFRERLEKCEDEILLSELIDEADKLFFQDRYADAAELYQRAVEINPDRRTIRRKEECEFLLSKEKTLRERLELEFAHRQNIDIKAIVNEEVAKREQNLRKVLEVKMRMQVQQETTQEANKSWEKMIWEKVASRDSFEFYDFYLELCPQGEYQSEALAKKELFALTDTPKTKEKPIIEHIEVKEEKLEHVMTLVDEVEPIFSQNIQNQDISEKETEVEVFQNTSNPKEEDRMGLFDDLIGDTGDDVIISKSVAMMDNIFSNMETPTIDNSIFEKSNPEINIFEMPNFNGVKTSPKVEEVVAKQEPVRKVSEEELWEEATSKNTIEGYMYYIENTIESSHIADAYYYISKIRNKTSEENTPIVATPIVPVEETVMEISRIQLDTSPSLGSSADDQDEVLWQDARNVDTVSAYYNYLNNSNSKKYREDAKKRISTLNEMEKLNEQREWEHATTLDTIDSYKQYLKKYPFGNFYAKARFRITKLESEMQV